MGGASALFFAEKLLEGSRQAVGDTFEMSIWSLEIIDGFWRSGTLSVRPFPGSRPRLKRPKGLGTSGSSRPQECPPPTYVPALQARGERLPEVGLAERVRHRRPWSSAG